MVSKSQTVELTHAVRLRKNIIVLQKSKFSLSENEVPNEWKALAPFLLGKSLKYHPNFLTPCASTLREMRTSPDRYIDYFYYEADYAGNAPFVHHSKF